MKLRFAPLVAAALGCLAAPALAQDEPAAPPPLPELVLSDVPPPDDTAVATEGGWQGQWQGEWAEDGTYRGTWNGTWRDPGPTAARAIYPDGVPGAGTSAAERTGWLNQCRNVYYPNSAVTGAVVAGQPDICESYLMQYERSYAAAAQGAIPAGSALAALPVAPAAPGVALPPGAYGYPYTPYAPVMWVRVPIIRQPAAPAPQDGE